MLIKKDFSDKTILLIDDDELIHVLIKEFLKNTNCNLLLADSGKEGLEFIKEYDVDLVILDLHMPVMNGYDTIKEIRKINKSIDIVMCTCDDQYHQVVYDAGVIAYIVKPIMYDKLLNILDMVLKLNHVSA